MLVDPEFVDIVHRGASLLPRMQRAIKRCRTEPYPKGDLARECGDLIDAYIALSERTRALPQSEIVQRLDRMLCCQFELVAQASELAFRVHDEGWPALAARFGDGEGPVADELLYLAASVSRPVEQAS